MRDNKYNFDLEYKYYECLQIVSIRYVLGIDPTDVLDTENSTPEVDLGDYLARFYKLHKGESWYDTHNYGGFVYRGYWSFESAAIVKALSIDDITLHDLDYYPYDLVHFDDIA